MDFRLFQALLAAGMRWYAREHRDAMTVAAFPHMQEQARRQMWAAVSGGIAAGPDMEPSTDQPDQADALDDFKALTRRHRQRWRMPEDVKAEARKTFERLGMISG